MLALLLAGAIYGIKTLVFYLNSGAITITSDSNDSLVFTIFAEDDSIYAERRDEVANGTLNKSTSLRVWKGEYTIEISRAVDEGSDNSVTARTSKYLTINSGETYSVVLPLAATVRPESVVKGSNLDGLYVESGRASYARSGSIYETALTGLVETPFVVSFRSLAKANLPPGSTVNVLGYEPVDVEYACRLVDKVFFAFINSGYYLVEPNKATALSSSILDNRSTDDFNCTSIGLVVEGQYLLDDSGKFTTINQDSSFNSIATDKKDSVLIYRNVDAYDSDLDPSKSADDNQTPSQSPSTSALWYIGGISADPEEVNFNEIITVASPISNLYVVASTDIGLLVYDRESTSIRRIIATTDKTGITSIKSFGDGFVYSTRNVIWYYSLVDDLSRIVTSGDQIKNGTLVVSGKSIVYVTSTTSYPSGEKVETLRMINYAP
ncbi:hypothetical protein MNBD_BACTEROID07-1667 [hydrothermal vent metagenome]|uniref:Uncharacterized protein n=1 Tax=hydrothermal vent metagenome TaxID=652676 RepID=A0A3B0UBC2_9ZZZZ